MIFLEIKMFVNFITEGIFYTTEGIFYITESIFYTLRSYVHSVTGYPVNKEQSVFFHARKQALV